jgi:ketosteroid isomerase-like protein
MSQKNVDIVRLCYELWSQRDFSRLFELVDPDVELDNSRLVFNPDIYRGHAGIEQFVSVVEDTWDDFRIVPTELIDAGDAVVAAITMQGKGKESGVKVEMRVFNVWTISDSKVVRVVGGYRDRSEALEVAGQE